jgi:hypothetical protein
MSTKTITLSGTSRVIDLPATSSSGTTVDSSVIENITVNEPVQGDLSASADTVSIDIQITDFGPLSDSNIVDNYREIYNVDTVSILDSAAISVTKPLAEDIISFSDQLDAIDVSKVLSDTYSMLDSITAIDLTKSLLDTVSIADTNYISMSKVLDDAVSFTSTGACLIQSYNNGTYFAEDYAVGSYAQFT